MHIYSYKYAHVLYIHTVMYFAYLEATKKRSYLWQNNVTFMNLIMQQSKVVVVFNIILRI
jgi:hypothetical protein